MTRGRASVSRGWNARATHLARESRRVLAHNLKRDNGVEYKRHDSNRSRVIEAAVEEFVRRRERAAREARDVEIINAHADEFARMMEDVLA